MQERLGESVIAFADPDGLRLQLIETRLGGLAYLDDFIEYKRITQGYGPLEEAL